MNKCKGIEDVYPCLDDLMLRLKRNGELEGCSTLKHRMYEVSWTSQSELYDELLSVLDEILVRNNQNDISKLIQSITKVIQDNL